MENPKIKHNSQDLLDVDNDSSDRNNDKIKRKRRSKNETEGRDYICDICKKSYLSAPALTNHKKTKHNTESNEIKRGRGRPRKNPIPATNENQYEQKFQNFFELAIRTNTNYPKYSTKDVSKEYLMDMFNTYSNKIFKNYKTIEEHPYYQMFERDEQALPSALLSEGLKKNTCDEVFFTYLVETSKQVNKDYYLFVFKFVVLFRECLNIYKKAEDESKEFTVVNTAETAPEVCNEFITEFMEEEDYYGLDVNELIEIIQHFCYWLYKNQYTSSRLSLLSSV